ncbi:DUF3618 domain-containing protein, partial [Streptomyces althioticus]
MDAGSEAAHGAKGPDELRREIERTRHELGDTVEELAAIVEKFGDDRKTKLIPYEGDMSIEDLIA